MSFTRIAIFQRKHGIGIIVDDIADDRGYIKGRYLHDGFIFSITNDGNTKDHLGRIVLEKIS